MSTKPRTCKATTASGNRCTRKAGSSGYCKIHEQKNQKDKKSAQYYEVIDTILGVCQKKGWSATLTSEDPDRQFIEISIFKRVEFNEVTGVIYVTVDDRVQYEIENTSFRSYGQRDLMDAIHLKLGELPWLESEKKKKTKEKEKEPAAPQLIVRVLKNFGRSARQLRHRYNNRTPYEINDEYDVQDLLHSILRAYFEDVRPEEYTPSYAGSSSKVDFLLKPEKSVIEVKYATEELKEKKIGEQLIIDIKKYQTHPDCHALYCLVYDPGGNIRNPIGFESDLSGKHNNLMVTVLVVPH